MLTMIVELEGIRLVVIEESSCEISCDSAKWMMIDETVQNLIRAEEEIVKGDMVVAGKAKVASTFINLTIIMVLGSGRKWRGV